MDHVELPVGGREALPTPNRTPSVRADAIVRVLTNKRWHRYETKARRGSARTAEMEENQTSESVAGIPDITESLSSETEEASALTNEHGAQAVAVTASVTAVPGVPGVPGVGVPVSLPVGSIIGVANSNGTTFNVITSEQLQVSFASGIGINKSTRDCVFTLCHHR